MAEIIEISDYEQGFQDALPETYRLLRLATLKVHPNVRRITLHGSRGPAGGYHDGSDIDLCLITDIDNTTFTEDELDPLLKNVLLTTLEYSSCPVELDLVAAFDRNQCRLACYNVNSYDELRCEKKSRGCIGLYKIQKGFDGFVPPISQLGEMYPLIAIWNR